MGTTHMFFSEITLVFTKRMSPNCLYLPTHAFDVLPEIFKALISMTLDLRRHNWVISGWIYLPQRVSCLELVNVGVFASNMNVKYIRLLGTHCLLWHSGLSKVKQGQLVHLRSLNVPDTSMTFFELWCLLRPSEVNDLIWPEFFILRVKIA